MTNTLLIKRSSTNLTPTSLQYGELAWSDTLSTLFIGKSGGLVEEVGGLGAFLSREPNLVEISLIPSTSSDEGTIPIVDSNGSFIGRKGTDLLTAIGVVGAYLPLTGGTLTGPLTISNTLGTSLVTNSHLSIGIADPTLGIINNSNDTLLTVSGKVDRPGFLYLNNPKVAITDGDLAGKVSFNLSSSSYSLKSIASIEGYAEGVESNIGGGLRFKVKLDGSNTLLEPLTINSLGNVLIGYGDQSPTLPSGISPVIGDRNLNVIGMDGAHGYLTLGQGTVKGALRWNSTNFQYYNSSTTSWISLVGSSSYTTDIGDGSSTSITVVHNLGSKDVVWQVYENNSPFEDVIPTVRRISINSLQFVFSDPPALNNYRVLITHNNS